MLLPSIVIQETLQYLSLKDFSSVPCVSQEWRQLSYSNEVWKFFYSYKFLRFNPNTEPTGFKENTTTIDYHENYRSRLADPELGDKVEVSWNGKFRLESIDVYHGLAW